MPLKIKIFSPTLNFLCRETTIRQFFSKACAERTLKKKNETFVAEEVLFSVKLKTSFPLTEIIKPKRLVKLSDHLYKSTCESYVLISGVCLLPNICL